MRSVLGCTNLLIHFYGLKHMPIADANMISSASPIWTAIFGRIFLKEPLKCFDIFNVFTTLLGILFIIRYMQRFTLSLHWLVYPRPPFIFGYDPQFKFDTPYYIAAVIVFCGSVGFQSNVYIILRKLKGLHFSVTLTVFGLIGTLESAIFMFALGDGCVPSCGVDRWARELLI